MYHVPLETRQINDLGFTCGDSIAPSYVQQLVKAPGHVAQKAELRKLNHYDNLINSHHFILACIETLGVWGDLRKEFIHEIGRNIKNETGEKRSTSYIFQNISVAV